MMDADYRADQQLVEEQFPEQNWKLVLSMFWVYPLTFIVNIGGFVAISLFVSKTMAFCTAIPSMIIICVIGRVHWVCHRHGEYRLTADGINYTGWKRPIRFEEIGQITTQAYKGNRSLIFLLKHSQPSPRKMSLLPLRRKSVSISVMGLDESPEVVTETVYRYFKGQRLEK